MTPEEIQEMINQSIAKAIDRHNKSAFTISFVLGSILLFFYAHGVISLVKFYR